MLDNICIIGCGRVGSLLGDRLISQRERNNLKNLFLVDYDDLEKKNLPYLGSKGRDLLGLSKSVALRYLLETNYEPDWRTNIVDIQMNYSDGNIVSYLYDNFLDKSRGCIFIDARDTKDIDSTIDYKINVDGPVFSITTNLFKTKVNTQSKTAGRYRLTENINITNIAVSLLMELIYNNSQDKDYYYLCDYSTPFEPSIEII